MNAVCAAPKQLIPGALAVLTALKQVAGIQDVVAGDPRPAPSAEAAVEYDIHTGDVVLFRSHGQEQPLQLVLKPGVDVVAVVPRVDRLLRTMKRLLAHAEHRGIPAVFSDEEESVLPEDPEVSDAPEEASDKPAEQPPKQKQGRKRMPRPKRRRRRSRSTDLTRAQSRVARWIIGLIPRGQEMHRVGGLKPMLAKQLGASAVFHLQALKGAGIVGESVREGREWWTTIARAPYTVRGEPAEEQPADGHGRKSVKPAEVPGLGSESLEYLAKMQAAITFFQELGPEWHDHYRAFRDALTHLGSRGYGVFVNADGTWRLTPLEG